MGSCARMLQPMRVMGYLMIVIVMALLCSGYAAFVVFSWGPRFASSPVLATFLLLVFHALFVMLVWCYLATVFTPPGAPPASWYPRKASRRESRRRRARGSDATPIMEEAERGGEDGELHGAGGALEASDDYAAMRERPFCRRCRCFKPERCHHCSICDTCVLKYDHHCPWVNTCIGYYNQKMFVLFLCYACVICLFCSVAQAPDAIASFGPAKGHPSSRAFVIMTTWLVEVSFGVCLLMFGGYHVHLMRSNMTTMEGMTQPENYSNPYNVGAHANMVQVLGRVRWRWFFPLRTDVGDGVHWQKTEEHLTMV